MAYYITVKPEENNSYKRIAKKTAGFAAQCALLGAGVQCVQNIRSYNKMKDRLISPNMQVAFKSNCTKAIGKSALNCVLLSAALNLAILGARKLKERFSQARY